MEWRLAPEELMASRPAVMLDLVSGRSVTDLVSGWLGAEPCVYPSYPSLLMD